MPSPLMWLTRFVGEFPGYMFGTDVALLPFHHPVRMASEAAMLDHMTKGKFALGIGLGYVKSEFALYDLNIRRRRAMFEESLTIMKELWTGDEVDYDGRFWKIKGTLPLKPYTNGGPKIWIGGQVKPAIERAARMADTFVGGISTPIQRFTKFTEMYRQALEKYGKDPSKADIPIMRTVWCDERKDTRDRINKIVSEQYKRSFAIREGHPMQYDEYATDYEHTVENRCIAGDPETCIEMVEKYRKIGVTGILCSFVTGEHTPDQVDDALKLFGKKVIPYFKDK
jgi:alkanesulfonate monooxygenase SsuD/methylene tetrahydromethanopterin reductase-like flavin-dependent oxidoreductase (luciferase family)